MKFATLDGMRGVAALSVAILHCQQFFGHEVLPNAHLAVDLFFVLSGFVIAHAYSSRLNSDMSFWRFAVARLIRLYPLYIAGTAIGLVAALGAVFLTAERSLTETVLVAPFAFLMLPFPMSSDGRLYPFNGVAWSLFFELIANGVVALFWRRLNDIRLLAALVLLGAAGMVASTLAFGTLNLGVAWQEFGGGLARVTFGFFGGVLLYRIYLRSASPIRVPPVLIMLALIPVFAVPYSGGYELTVALLVFPALVYLAVQVEPSAFVRAVCLTLGSASYALYVLHVPLRQLVEGALRAALHIPIESVTPSLGLVFVTVVTIVCVGVDRWFDAPVRRLLTSLTSNRRTLGVATA